MTFEARFSRSKCGLSFAKTHNVPQVGRQFSEARSSVATTTATFSEPGDYQRHVLVNDYSGEVGGGFQCCWTTGIVKVAVQPN